MTVTVAWQHLGSPTSGMRLIDAQDDPSLTAMARGLCDRCCTWLGEAIGAAAAEAEIATWPGEWRDEQLQHWTDLFLDERCVPLLPVGQSFPGASPPPSTAAHGRCIR